MIEDEPVRKFQHTRDKDHGSAGLPHKRRKPYMKKEFPFKGKAFSFRPSWRQYVRLLFIAKRSGLSFSEALHAALNYYLDRADAVLVVRYTIELPLYIAEQTEAICHKTEIGLTPERWIEQALTAQIPQLYASLDEKPLDDSDDKIQADASNLPPDLETTTPGNPEDFYNPRQHIPFRFDEEDIEDK